MAAPASATASEVMAWGANDQNQLANATVESSDVPLAVSGLSGVRAMSAGGEHSLALLNDGTVMAWGANEFGQLGDGTTTPRVGVPFFERFASSPAPEAVRGLSGVTAVSGGGFFSLALLSNGTVMAWGNNEYGQLGDGATANSPVPVASNVLSATVVSAGLYHSLALLSDGTVTAWGRNTEGQLGNGTTINSSVPVPVSALSGVTAIAGGWYHSLALLSNRTVVAWGENEQGQLGNGSSINSSLPVPVSELSEVSSVSAGGYHSLSEVPPPPPSVSSIAPASGPSAGATAVTIKGSGFVAGATVTIGSAATAVKVLSGSELTATTSATAPGAYEVVVSDANGTSSGGPSYTYTAPPSVSSIAPASGPSAGATAVTIKGSGFVAGATVTIGSAATAVKVLSGGELTATTSATAPGA